MYFTNVIHITRQNFTVPESRETHRPIQVNKLSLKHIKHLIWQQENQNQQSGKPE